MPLRFFFLHTMYIQCFTFVYQSLRCLLSDVFLKVVSSSHKSRCLFLVLPEWRPMCSPAPSPLHSASVVKVTKKDGGCAENKNTNTRVHSCSVQIVSVGRNQKANSCDQVNPAGSLWGALSKNTEAALKSSFPEFCDGDGRRGREKERESSNWMLHNVLLWQRKAHSLGSQFQKLPLELNYICICQSRENIRSQCLVGVLSVKQKDAPPYFL